MHEKIYEQMINFSRNKRMMQLTRPLPWKLTVWMVIQIPEAKQDEGIPSSTGSVRKIKMLFYLFNFNAEEKFVC